MSKFDEREQEFEARYKHDQDLAFKVASRRNKLLGLWAADHLGLTGAEAETYAQDIVAAEFAKPGHAQIVAKLVRDFAAKGIPIDAAQITDEYHRLAEMARTQVLAE
jgi:hypothetical protein